MDEKSIIIIGGGIAGLSAGCYARLNHYRTKIFEQDTKPGGLNTSWERGPFTINGGLAFLMGSGPGVGFYRIWEELGVVPKMRMIEYEHLLIVEGKEGQNSMVNVHVGANEGVREVETNEGDRSCSAVARTARSSRSWC